MPDIRPAPPTIPQTIFEIIFPYRLGIRTTSNCCGLETNCIEALSTIIEFNSNDGYSDAASSLQTYNEFLIPITINSFRMGKKI